MVRLLGIGIEVFSSVIFVVPAIFLLQYVILKQRSFSKTAAVMIFALYLTAVFSAAGIPSVTFWRFHPEFNLIPLIDIVNSPPEYIRNTILNIILFVPLGFFVPVIWKEYRSMRVILMMGLGLSLFIELLQMFTFRLTDVDDLITNTMGTMLGYHAAKRFSFRLPWKPSEKGNNHYHKRYRKYEPVIILGLAFFIVFCLKSFLSDAIWDAVLSSGFWERIRG